MGVKLAFLGAGNIAEFHAQSAAAAGFVLAGVASKPGSSRAARFGSKHQFKRIFFDEDELFRSNDWDALVICSSHETLLPAVKRALKDGRPALVEKPVALQSSELVSLEDVPTEKISVAFNRRFYPSVERAKMFFATLDNAIVTLEIPETVSQTAAKGDPYRQVRTNSVHMLDLLSYIVGGFSLSPRRGNFENLGPKGSFLFANSWRNDIIMVKAAWNSPSNFSFSIESDNQRFELRPIEIGRLYENMQVIEPTGHIPIRRFEPICVEQTPSANDEMKLKPGFFGQMSEFHRLVSTGVESQVLASIRDARIALQLAEKLVPE